MNGTFRSLTHYNYRAWAAGALISNVGTWMQRTAQDWLVLTQLTHNNATAVGIVMALQFGPQIFLLPVTGMAADVMDRRKLLISTQAALGLFAAGLGILTITGHVQLWHVYVFALLMGIAAAFDAPARQTFVSELVPEMHLPNAVALNSTSFNAGRMVGPAMAGVLIAAMGTGPAFLLNGFSYIAVIISLCVLRPHELIRSDRASRARGGLVDGVRYVRSRSDLRTVLWMLFFVGTFGLNFPIFISTMSVKVFHAGASEYGILTSTLATGSVIGALMAARRERPTIPLLCVGAGIFGTGITLAAVMPAFWPFGVALVVIGIAAQTFNTGANAVVQLTTEGSMRGRVMALYMAIAMGSTLFGAPLVGRVADTYGPRWGMAVGAFGGFAALLVGIRYLALSRKRQMIATVPAGIENADTGNEEDRTPVATAS